MTREEIAEDLRRRGGAWEGLRLAYLLMYAELERIICSGAPKGKHHTYALFDERVGPSETLSRDESLARLTLAYFRSRGPATVRDFCAWATLAVADATRGLAIVANELERVEVDARTFWFREAGNTGARSSRTAHFLQGYDEYFMSYRESRGLAFPKKSASATSGEQVPFIHAAILHGQVVAHWRRKVHRDHVQLETHVTKSVSRAGRAALARAADEYARFLGVPVDLTMDVD